MYKCKTCGQPASILKISASYMNSGYSSVSIELSSEKEWFCENCVRKETRREALGKIISGFVILSVSVLFIIAELKGWNIPILDSGELFILALLGVLSGGGIIAQGFYLFIKPDSKIKK